MEPTKAYGEQYDFDVVNDPQNMPANAQLLACVESVEKRLVATQNGTKQSAVLEIAATFANASGEGTRGKIVSWLPDHVGPLDDATTLGPVRNLRT